MTEPKKQDLTTPLLPGKQTSTPRWYFAYGSNMKASSMTDRKITPLAAQAVQVPGFYLTFDVFGIPFSEPSYASIEAFPEEALQETVELLCINGNRRFDVPPVCGIAYLLSPEDFHRLLVTEGSGVVYETIEAEAKSLALPSTIPSDQDLPKEDLLTVYTLKAKYPQRPNGTPSLRYMASISQSPFPPAKSESLTRPLC
jgi:hypothetical protein